MKINDKLPDFKFKVDEDKIIDSKELKGQSLIIYFYPKDDTPGCTVEAIEFSKSKNKFSKLNTKIFGISKDSIEKHKKYSDQKSEISNPIYYKCLYCSTICARFFKIKTY